MQSAAFPISNRLWRAGLLLLLLWNVGFGIVGYLYPEKMWESKENHDTRVLYSHILRENAPLKWFVGDWPLYNGFYRPLPSLAFEADVRLWGRDLAKYKLFNAATATACVLLLAMFVLNLTQSRGLALGSAAAFTVWQTDLHLFVPFLELSALAGLALAGVGLWRLRGWARWALLGLSTLYLGHEMAFVYAIGDLSQQSFGYRAMSWPPGRTATLFTLSALLCLASYCAWERTRAGKWLVLGALGFVGAFLSYEQAVVLPAALFACGLYLRLEGVRVRIAPHLAAWALLGLYCWLHFTYLPFEARYAAEHDRSARAGLAALATWVFPGWQAHFELSFLADPSIGAMAVVLPLFWSGIGLLAANLAAWRIGWQRWKLLAFALATSAVVYGPLAFQIQLNHYLYFPMALRSLFVAGLAALVWRSLLTLAKPAPPPSASVPQDEVFMEPEPAVLNG
jgi:hypothetical protein